MASAADVTVKVDQCVPYADRCPVCDGRGMVPGWFYGELTVAVFKAQPWEVAKHLANREPTDPETCRACKGDGWVIVR